ncbi:MAG: hypothetical protein OXR67_10710 [Chloroflexota bacterium]|nr:hypothetical protein [Chloroflexota bacterium]
MPQVDLRSIVARIRDYELLLLAVALFLLLTAIYVFSVEIRATRGASITGDEPFYLLTTQSLLTDGDFDLANQYESRSYTSFFDHPDGLWFQSVPQEDGQVLSPHNPGLSLLVIPGFVLGGLVGVQTQLLLIASASLALAFVLADRLTGHRITCWVVTLGVGLTATAFVYSTEIYPEFPAALALVVALLLVTRLPRPGAADGLWLAAVLTVMCWLGIKYAPLALIVSSYYILRADRSGRTALLLAGGLSATVFAGFHVYLFGGLTPYGNNAVYAQWNTAEILAGHVEFGERYYRLWGIFIDRQFGIGRWAPLLLVALPGLALLTVGKGSLRLVLALVLAQLLMATFVAITMMGWWFAGRTMVTVLPLFAVPIALVVARSHLWGKVGVAMLGCYSLAITVGLASAAHAGEITIAVDPFDMAFPPFQGLAGLFPLYTLWTTETWWLTFFWLTLAGLAIGTIAWSELASTVRKVHPRKWRLPGHAPYNRGNTIT